MTDNIDYGRMYLLPVRVDKPRKFGHAFITLQVPGTVEEDDSGDDEEDSILVRGVHTLIPASRIRDLEMENARLRDALNEYVYFWLHRDYDEFDPEVKTAISNAAKALNQKDPAS